MNTSIANISKQSLLTSCNMTIFFPFSMGDEGIRSHPDFPQFGTGQVEEFGVFNSHYRDSSSVKNCKNTWFNMGANY